MNTRIFVAKWMVTCGSAFLLAMPPMAAESGSFSEMPVLPHSSENSAWLEIASRFQTLGTVVLAADGKPSSIKVEVLKGYDQSGSYCQVSLDKETGHVIGVQANLAGFHNDEFASFKAFPQLKSLKLFHNGIWQDKSLPEDQYDAKGISQLNSLQHLEVVILAGGHLSDAGMQAVASLPHLRELGMWHVPVTDVGIAHLANHPTLESIRIAPGWSRRITNASLETLATCPNLEDLNINETHLTFEDGAAFLVQREQPLKRIDLRACVIDSAEVERLREAFPDTEIAWEGLATAGLIFQDKPYLLRAARTWMPEALLERALQAGAASKTEADSP